MSYTHYHQSISIAVGEQIGEEPAFYSIIMAAMRRADTNNLEKLKESWPEVWNELVIRYKAPAGFVSEKEASSIGGYSNDQLNGVEFPMEGWPYGA